MTTRSRTPLVLAIVLAVVAVVAVAAVVLSGGDDDGNGTSSTVPPGTAGGAATVVVEGMALQPGDGPSDPSIGTAAPALSGTDYAGEPVEIVPGADGPMMVVFLAHWCPHCNDEIPVLQQWADEGGIPDDLHVVGVSTAVNAERPNYPPDDWLVEKGWEWPVLADDGELTAAEAYGVTGFPFLTFIDADGNVTARASGELPIETLQALADAAVTA